MRKITTNELYEETDIKIEEVKTMNDKVYDVLKYLAIICLPALEEFVKRVFPIWNIPYANEIAQTLNAIAVLVGALICLSVISYNKAKINAEVDLDNYKDVNEE